MKQEKAIYVAPRARIARFQTASPYQASVESGEFGLQEEWDEVEVEMGEFEIEP